MRDQAARDRLEDNATVLSPQMGKRVVEMDYGKITRAFFDGRLGVPAEQAQLVRREAFSHKIPLMQVLLQHSGIKEADFLVRVADIGGTSFTDLHQEDISSDAIDLVQAGLAQHFGILPLALNQKEVVIAASDPFNEDLCGELALLLNRPVRLVLATSDSIRTASRRHYGVGADTVEQLVSSGSSALLAQPAEGALNEEDAAEDVSVIKLLSQIILDAIEQRATDIHFEPYEGELRVRYRVDGVLREAGVPAAAKHFCRAIVSRAKIVGNLDIAERRLPQDGRSQINLDGQTYDLRISILPTPHGEALNIRILPRATMIDDLSTLGFEGRDLLELHRLIRKPHGIFLVTGPTGSGKTTTLYTILKILNAPETKILTVEDPIEYRMRGLVQMQVNPEIGFTFARALRSMLRHDPDVMLIGEIRDYETAEITIRTALTGHLVFSTLHTNDAPTAMGRLIDIGVEPFLIASSVEGVLAQRLIRLVCPSCKVMHEANQSIHTQIGPGAETIEQVAIGEGCRECRFTGYRGRTSITELMVMDSAIREMVTSKRNADDLRKEAVRRGMQLLRSSGIRKIRQGITTVDEILRVTPSPDADGSVIVDQM